MASISMLLAALTFLGCANGPIDDGAGILKCMPSPEELSLQIIHIQPGRRPRAVAAAENAWIVRFSRLSIETQRSAMLRYVDAAREDFVANPHPTDLSDHAFDLGKLDFLAIGAGKPAQIFQKDNISMYVRDGSGCGIALSPKGFWFQDTGPGAIRFIRADDYWAPKLRRLVRKGAFDLVCPRTRATMGTLDGQDYLGQKP